jgi:5-methylcytosine-specific restriction endonuclease McrA
MSHGAKVLFELPIEFLKYVPVKGHIPLRHADKEYKLLCKNAKYRLFQLSTICCGCGIRGNKLVVKEVPEHKDHVFITVYAGKVPLTKDHIRPRSFGGGPGHKNMRVLCGPCNNIRGSWTESLLFKKKVVDYNLLLRRLRYKIPKELVPHISDESLLTWTPALEITNELPKMLHRQTC